MKAAILLYVLGALATAAIAFDAGALGVLHALPMH